MKAKTRVYVTVAIDAYHDIEIPIEEIKYLASKAVIVEEIETGCTENHIYSIEENKEIRSLHSLYDALL